MSKNTITTYAKDQNSNDGNVIIEGGSHMRHYITISQGEFSITVPSWEFIRSCIKASNMDAFILTPENFAANADN